MRPGVERKVASDGDAEPDGVWTLQAFDAHRVEALSNDERDGELGRIAQVAEQVTGDIRKCDLALHDTSQLEKPQPEPELSLGTMDHETCLLQICKKPEYRAARDSCCARQLHGTRWSRDECVDERQGSAQDLHPKCWSHDMDKSCTLWAGQHNASQALAWEGGAGIKDGSRAIVTVQGPIAAIPAGFFLAHEHLFGDLSDAWYAPPATESIAVLAARPIALETLWSLHEHPYARADNLRLDDFEVMTSEVEAFASVGGYAIVECSVRGISPNPNALRALARRTGVHVIAGTGYYVARTHPPEVELMSIEEIGVSLIADLTEGFIGTDIRAGFIGELGIGGTTPAEGVDSIADIHPNERKILAAAAVAHRATDAAIVVHPPRSSSKKVARSALALGLLDLLEADGVDPRRVVLCHLDSSGFEDLDIHREIARRGAFVEYDAWGWNDYFSLQRGDGFWNDLTRLQFVDALVSSGYADRLLMSQDIATKYRLQRYGGHGYGYLLRVVVPMMRAFGIAEAAIETMLKGNPASLFARPSLVPVESREVASGR